MKRYLNHSALAVTLAMLAAGCSQMQKTEGNIEAVTRDAVTLRDAAVENAIPGSVQRTSRPRLAGEEVVLRSQDALPPIFGKRMVYATQGVQSLTEVLDGISTMAGIAIAANEISQSGTRQGAGNTPFNASSANALNGQVSLEFNGTLKALLDELAMKNEASWRFDKKTNSVEFFRFETRTLSVFLPPGSKTVSASISLAGVSGGGGSSGSGGASSSGSSSGGSGAGNVSVEQNLTVNPWKSILSGVQSILSEGAEATAVQGGGTARGGDEQLVASGPGGRAAANPELGLLTVTARPKVAARVASYIDSINARFAQNVMIDIKIYSLTMNANASAGFSMDGLYKFLNNNGVSIVGPAQVTTDGTPGRLTLSVNNPLSKLNGSSLMAQALSQYGNVALQTQGQVLAVNGQPSPIQVANEINYLASSQLTQAANVGTTSTLTPGTRVVGFTGNFLPLILGDNRILLQYQLQLSSLTALTQVSSGTSTIQTPQISSQSLQQQAFVKDGQSIVLFGFDQNRDSSDTAAGIGGASKGSRSERQMVVIVMQVNGGAKAI